MNLKVLILICFLIASWSGLAQTTRITNFDDLMANLNAGEQIRVVIHYALCKWSPEQAEQSPVPDAITGMDIDTYEYFAPGAVHNKFAFVVFANSKLIMNPVGKGFVYNYGKVRINADNTVQVTAKYIHPKNFNVKMNESFSCKLNDGTNNEGINLFK
ncbi:MAG: VirK family protein [Bacteroidota bacterium]